MQGKDTPGIFVIRQHSQGSIHKDVPIAKSTTQGKPPPVYNSLKYNNHHHPHPPPHQNNYYLDDSLLTTSIWSDASHKSQQPQVQQTLPTIHQYSNLKKSPNIDFNGLFYKDGTLGSQSAHSRDDDDCTTTSGSYTINDERDFDDEFLSHNSKDMYV